MITYRKSKQKDFEEFKQAVSQAMATSKSRVTLSSKLLTSDLSELVDMFKSGKISKEEFDSQKEILIENL
jgi:BMFP domain-containing protein YqiC